MKEVVRSSGGTVGKRWKYAGLTAGIAVVLLVVGAGMPMVRRVEMAGSGLSPASKVGIAATFEGTKQGGFKGEAGRSGSPVLSFAYEVSSPRDVATGQASGKRQHKPIVITKEWGPASPQLFQACVTNEVLKSVVLNFSRTNASGEEEVYYTIKLTNATVSGIRQYTPDPQKSLGTVPLEEVSFTFQKIEMESVDGKTVAMDDWMGAM